MCWPNRSVLKIGFRTEDDDGSPWFFEAPNFFADGWWAFENRSDVALGMSSRSGSDQTSFRTVHFTPCATIHSYRSYSQCLPCRSLG